MISIAALRPALNAVIPHLPKAAGVALTRTLPFLPLAFELAKVLFQHREKIGTVTNKLVVHTSNGIKKGTTGVVKVVPYLPKKIGRKMGRCLQYFPLTFEIAKASYSKNSNRVCELTKQFPSEVKQKISRTLKRHQCPCCSNLFSKSQQL